MPVTEYLIRNAELYPDEVALVELNPDEKDTRRTTWKEFDLIQPSANMPYRREITWSVFNEKANRFANECKAKYNDIYLCKFSAIVYLI